MSTTVIPGLETLPQIHSAGEMLFDPIWSRHIHRSGRCELIHVIDGQVSMVVGERRLEAADGGTIIIPEGVDHRDHFDWHAGLTVFMVQFSWPAARVCFDPALSRRAPTQAVQAELERIIARFRADWGGGDGDLPLHRARLLTILLLLSDRDRGPGPEDSVSPARTIVLQAKEFLREHFCEQITLDRIAETVGVSPYHLSHVFSQENDFSLFAELTHLRMDHARTLLRQGGRLADAAGAVGYDDPHYFSRAFKRHFGHRPSDERRRSAQ